MVRARVFGLRAIEGKTGQPKVSGGYTFIEVMIVLAVSALMFVAAMVAIGGQQNETGFSLAMQDVNSKIQNYVSQVTASNGFDLSSYKCAPNTNGFPRLNTASDSGDCIYLGIALQATPGSSSIYAYNVIGNRTSYANGVSTGLPATTVDEADPTPALDNDTGQFLAVDVYNLTAGATVTKASLDGAAYKNTAYNLVGIYNALPDDTITAGTGAGGVVLKAYPFSSLPTYAESTVLADCIEEGSPCGANQLVDGQQWDMCMQSADGKHTAQLSLVNSTNGLASQLTFDSCNI